MDFMLTLQNEKEAFERDLDPKWILPSLEKTEVISKEECKIISSKATRQERFNALFQMMTSSLKTFSQRKCFIDALEEEDEEGCSPYPWLAEKLKSTLKLDDEVHRTLVRGNVPVPVNHLLPRVEKIEDIRKKLKESTDPGNPEKWVVLHGPIGSGKSCLASEALRDNFLNKIFSDGVFWLDFGGHKVKSASEPERHNCDEKIKNILKLLDDSYKFNPSEDLTYLLRNAVVSKNMLLILDEVCDESIIKRFNVLECPKLVTTTLKNIMNDVKSYCTFIECPNDAQNSDLKLLLSKYVNCEVEELPDVVQDICDKCGKSLLVASLIGGSMNYVGNDEETWKYWNKKLEENGLAGLEKIEEKDVLNVIINCLEYIKDWQEYFFDLVIFKKDVFVSNEVLEIMWNKKVDQLPVFQIAVQLHQRSFVVLKETDSTSKFSCCSHELYVHAVKNHLREVKIKELHKKFVDKVFELGRLSNGFFDFTKLPTDYVPDFIDYHLYQAGEFDLLGELYLDLKFVEQKIRLKNNPESILMDYECYKNCFKNKEDLEHFKLFLQRNERCILMEEKCDIIQLALFESHDSIVYKKAKEYANKNKGFYYDWCNTIRNIQEFKIGPCSNVKFGAINQDASLVAFIDGFKPEESEHKASMKVWHFPTANEFTKEDFHTDTINYCAFSSKGDYLATASADTNVNIFKINLSSPENHNFIKKHSSKESAHDTKLFDLLLPFEDHEFEVIYCSFSSDDQYIISSDMTGITLVWKFNVPAGRKYVIETELLRVCENTKEPLRFSSLSKDLKTVGTAVYDTLKLWDREKTDTEKKIFHCEDKIINKFIFADDGSRILIMQDHAVLFWYVKNDKTEIIFSDESCRICCCCLSTSSKYIACGMKSGQIVFIVVDTKEYKVLPGHCDEIVNVMFSMDETKLFSISSTSYIIRNVSVIENAIFINGNFNVAKEQELTVVSSMSPFSIEIRKGEHLTPTILRGEEKISAFSLSNDGSEIVIGTEYGSVKVFNINENSSEELKPKHSREITFVLHSKNNNSFFTCSVDSTINVWHKKTHHVTLGEPNKSGHEQPVVMCSEFKKSDKLLSCRKDGSLMVWNSDSGECIYTIDGHDNNEITCCDISSNDVFLAAAFANGSIKIWKAIDGSVHQHFSRWQPKRSFWISRRVEVRCCQFSPATDLLIAGLSSGRIMVNI